MKEIYKLKSQEEPNKTKDNEKVEYKFANKTLPSATVIAGNKVKIDTNTIKTEGKQFQVTRMAPKPKKKKYNNYHESEFKKTKQAKDNMRKLYQNTNEYKNKFNKGSMDCK